MSGKYSKVDQWRIRKERGFFHLYFHIEVNNTFFIVNRWRISLFCLNVWRKHQTLRLNKAEKKKMPSNEFLATRTKHTTCRNVYSACRWRLCLFANRKKSHRKKNPFQSQRFSIVLFVVFFYAGFCLFTTRRQWRITARKTIFIRLKCESIELYISFSLLFVVVYAKYFCSVSVCINAKK